MEQNVSIKNIIRISISVSILSLAFLLSACDTSGNSTGGNTRVPKPSPAAAPLSQPPAKYKAIHITVQARAMVPLVTAKAYAYASLDTNGNGNGIGHLKLIRTGIKWASSDPKVATVNSAGLIKALSPGTTFITSSSGGVTSNKHRIDVLGSPIDYISISTSPRNDFDILKHALAGDQIQLVATARLMNGEKIDISSAVNWNMTLPPEYASISDYGLLKLKAGPSKAVIRVIFRGTKIVDGKFQPRPAYAFLTIRPTPTNLTPKIHIYGVKTMHKDIPHHLKATLMYIGRPRKSNSFAVDVTYSSVWTSSDPTVASVNKQYGVVTGHKAGHAMITDTYTLKVGISPPVVVTSFFNIEITDEKITGIELQETYTQDGSGTLLSGQTKDIPILPSGYYGRTFLHALFMALYIDYANGKKEYVPKGASWWSSDPTAAYTPADQYHAYVYGRATASHVKITAAYKGFRTSFFVNVESRKLGVLTSIDVYSARTGEKIIPNKIGYNIDDPNGFNFLDEGDKIPIRVIGNFSDGDASKDITPQIDMLSQHNNTIVQALPDDIPGKTLMAVSPPIPGTTIIKLDNSFYSTAPMAPTILFEASFKKLLKVPLK